MAACNAARRRTRSALRRQATLGSYSLAPSTTARIDRCGHGPDLCPTTTPERQPPTGTTHYTTLDQGLPPWSRPQGVAAPLGRFYFRAPLPGGARPEGKKSSGTKGAQGWVPESFRAAKPEGRHQAEFLGALARTTFGATLVPFSRILVNGLNGESRHI